MEHKKTLEEVRKIFEGDRFATENGAVMGGTYFMLADFAFAVAANWENMGCVSLHSDISFLSSAKGEKLIAKAVCVKDGRATACYRVDVTDELGNLAATVTTNAFRIASGK